MSVEMDFDKIDEAQGYPLIPEGWYLCQLSEVDERQTKSGDPMWALKWEIIEGEFEGRFIWDNLVFKQEVYGRIKLLLRRCGVKTEGSFTPTPAMIEGKTVKVQTEHNSYEKDGKTVTNNKVAFDGYDYPDASAPEDNSDEREAEATEEEAAAPGEGLPF